MSDPQGRGPELIFALLHNPVTRVLVLVALSAYAVVLAVQERWVWFAGAAVLIAIYVISIILQNRGWRPPWIKQP